MCSARSLRSTGQARPGGSARPVRHAYYLPDPQADLWRVGGIFVLSLAGEEIAAITRFGEGGWLPWFGLPRTLPD